MRRSTVIASTAAGAILLTGLLAGPAMAGNWASWGNRGPNAAGGPNAGGGADGAGSRAGISRTVDPLAGLTQGNLTTAQKTALAAMAEEEKLAHDVYVKLAETSGDSRFSRIANSEARHVTEVQALLARYAIADPSAGKAVGVFTSDSFQTLYDDLVASGDDSPATALAVGRQIETLDIADLAKASAGVTAPDVLAVYDRLTNGSESHLVAFSR
jgi:hypothetical protein